MAEQRLALITGVSGFIAKHVALRYLQAGWSVRGTLRSLERADEVRAALAPHLDPAILRRLSFAAADLTSDEGWAAAATGAHLLVHTASPFPMSQPKDAAVLLRPAVEGTLRALRAARAAGIRRAIVTSSTVAVIDETRAGTQDERNWCDLTAPGTSAYAMSKTMAERAAWEFVAKEAPEMALTCINPGFVMGPPLDRHFGTSLNVVRRILAGRDPMVPMIGFVCVDVRDVAEMHLRAALRSETAGKRYLAAAGTMTMPDMARVLKAAYPYRRIPTRVAPYAVLRALALFDGAIRGILPSVGKMYDVSNARAQAEMAMRFIEPADALLASAEWLLTNKAV
ncbi:NAD-dependent epimerase/dehydratase family protein [bacterium]|nr:NAD-dependent epimerase/dehydratase family protein [bacterium]